MSEIRTLIIAEVGSVHDGSFGNALHLIDTAAACGANAAKFQTHIAEAETLRDAAMPPYFDGEPRYEYFQRTSFSEVQWHKLRARADERGIEFISSPFSIEAVDLLERIGVGQYKIPSGEVTNLLLLEAIASTGKPVILSSGMSAWEELDAAVEVIRSRHQRITLLQCTSAYPCPYEEVGLNVMAEMEERYSLPVGLSDHTLTTYAAVAAVTLGASVVEKHLTFSRRMYGSDARHSLEPQEFEDMVRGIRAAETMRSSAVDKGSMARRMRPMKEIFQKSIVSLVDIAAGDEITGAMVGVKKPGTGIPPSCLQNVIGKRARRAIEKDRLIAEEDLAEPRR